MTDVPGEKGTAGDSSFDEAPRSATADESGDYRRRCESERDTMSPMETSDCAGVQIADAYENEEDDGS